MKSNLRLVISASRRTDIPSFYMSWFMDQIKTGFFEIVNPYNKKKSIISAKPEDVHTIVFWSKNFETFIKENIGNKLQKLGYNIFFNFTINSDSILEPNIPNLSKRIDQLDYLSDNFDPKSIQVRFDPICFWKQDSSNKLSNNLNDFIKIADFLQKNKILRLITSFVDLYPKIYKRTAKIEKFSFVNHDIEKKKDVILKMEKQLLKKNINLYLCCEKDLLNSLPKNSSIKPSSCIPNDLLVKLFKGKISQKKDSGQRANKGCGCKTSVDIGNYLIHKCYNNCLYCYANPATK